MKKIKARLICLIVAGVILVGAVTVAAIEGSPYETLRNAVFNAMVMDNFTLKGELTVKLNGEIYEIESVHYINTADGVVDLTDTMTRNASFGYFITDGLELRPSIVTYDGAQWYSVRTTRATDTRPGILFSVEDFGPARFRFMELLVDLFVGDLRNNMYMSSNDGIRQVSGSITHNQLPEIIRVGMDMLIEENLRWYRDRGELISRDTFSSPANIPIQSLTVNRINGHANIDEDGNLLHMSGDINLDTINIFGDNNVMELSFNIGFYDIGTSVAQSPIYGVVELFTPEFMQRQFGLRYGIVYFTRDADGGINRESLTATWPGQLNR